MKKIFYLMLGLLLFGTATVKAQVTIGADVAPEDFSVLELISGAKNAGLRLPQLDHTQREALEVSAAFQNKKTGEAVGLSIFNTTSQCIETWTGEQWIRKCNAAPAVGQVASRIEADGPISWVTFMSYNLGADPTKSIIEQLLFKSAIGESNVSSYVNKVAAEAAHFPQVYGSLYQWGRKSDGHQNVWSSIASVDGVSEAYLDPSTGQVDRQQDPTSIYYGKFIKGVTSNWFDWIAIGTWTPPLWQYPARWDGVGVGAGAGSHPVKVTNGNDPCPSGFRVPIVSEWYNILEGVSFYNGDCQGLNEWVWVESRPTMLRTDISTLRGFEDETSGTFAGTSGYLVYGPNVGIDGEPDGTYHDTPDLFLPVAGFRDLNGNLDPGISHYCGHYWSSTAYSNDSYDQSFALFLTPVGADVLPIAGNHRSNGCSVRCIAE